MCFLELETDLRYVSLIGKKIPKGGWDNRKSIHELKAEFMCLKVCVCVCVCVCEGEKKLIALISPHSFLRH